MHGGLARGILSVSSHVSAFLVERRSQDVERKLCAVREVACECIDTYGRTAHDTATQRAVTRRVQREGKIESITTDKINKNQ